MATYQIHHLCFWFHACRSCQKSLVRNPKDSRGSNEVMRKPAAFIWKLLTEPIHIRHFSPTTFKRFEGQEIIKISLTHALELTVNVRIQFKPHQEKACLLMSQNIGSSQPV